MYLCSEESFLKCRVSEVTLASAMLSNLVSETTKQDPSCNKVEFHLPTHFPPCGSPWVPGRRDARVWLLSQLFTSDTMTVNKFCGQHKPALCPVWDRSPLLKKPIFTSTFTLVLLWSFFFYVLSCRLSFCALTFSKSSSSSVHLSPRPLLSFTSLHHPPSFFSSSCHETSLFSQIPVLSPRL